jgi:secreted trypsin-like serine protease
MIKNILLLLTLLTLVTTSVNANESVDSELLVQAESDQIEIAPRIIGGTVADSNEFKFYARLLATDYQTVYYHLCGATLLNEQYVLTAAHCVDVEKTGFAKENLAIVVDNADFSGVTSSEFKEIDSIYIHPAYDADGLINDIAIIKLTLKVTEDVEFISIPTDDDKLYYEQLATMSVTGLGYIDNIGTPPETLLTTEVKLLSDTQCSDLVFSKFKKVFIASNSLCVIPITGNGSCAGDSGGPLTYVDSDGKNKQTGLVSYGGATCAEEGIPTVYTELYGYSEWIKNTINGYVVSNTSSGGSLNYVFLLMLFSVTGFRRKWLKI